MQTPNGGSASFPNTRLGLAEDDNTFAPPPMSAYSIAVFSNNAAAQTPGKTHEKSPQTGIFSDKYGWNPPQNSALRDSLKRKLSVRFIGSTLSQSPPSIPNSTAQKVPKSPKSPSFNIGSSNSATNTTSASFGDHVDSLSSHSLGHSGNSQTPHSGDFFPSLKTTDNRENVGRPSLQKDTSQSVMNNENVDSHMLLQARKSTSSPKLLTASNDRFHLGSSNLPNEAKLTDSSSVSSPSFKDQGLRPNSSGSGTRKSRVSRRFHTLGPPKRASEVALVSASTSAVTPEEKAESHIQPSPPDISSNDSFSKRQVSTDSDFFKSLKRLKEASPKPQAGLAFNYNRRPESPQSSVEPMAAKQGFVKPNLHEHRQPLRDVSPGIINTFRGPEGFKKPKLPRAQEPSSEKVDLVKDPTPQVPAAIPAKRVAHANLTRANGSHVDDDRRKKTINLNSREYEKLEILGRGGSSKVYKVRSLTDKKPYALKKVSFDQFDESCVRGFKGEIDLLMRLKHEVRVVSLIDHAASAGSLYLLMECGDLDLAHVLQNKLSSTPTLDPNFVRFHASEVFHCIQAVHNAGIIHSDLKPANFLFVGGILKIIDFGIANAVPDHTVNIYRHSQIGTPNYMAPEALVEVNNTLSFASKNSATTWRVGRPSDIWSCGCIIYQMIYGRPPYASYSGQQRIMAIMNPQVKVQYAPTGLGGVTVPLSAIELMQKCLERNPSDRWTVEECLACDFLKPKAVNDKFVKDLLQNAISLGHRTADLTRIDERAYDELVNTILGQIKDLNFA